MGQDAAVSRPRRSGQPAWSGSPAGSVGRRVGCAAAAVVCVLAYAAGGTSVLRAAEAPAVAVLDQQAVLEQTKAGKRALGTLKEFAAARQKIIAADDQELKRLEQEIRTHQDSWSDEERRAKQEAFRAKVEAYQRRVQDFNREVQVKQRELANEFRVKIAKVAAEVAAKRGYALVVDKGNEAVKIVLYHRLSIDLTDAVVKEFDRRHK